MIAGVEGGRTGFKIAIAKRTTSSNDNNGNHNDNSTIDANGNVILDSLPRTENSNSTTTTIKRQHFARGVLVIFRVVFHGTGLRVFC